MRDTLSGPADTRRSPAKLSQADSVPTLPSVCTAWDQRHILKWPYDASWGCVSAGGFFQRQTWKDKYSRGKTFVLIWDCKYECRSTIQTKTQPISETCWISPVSYWRIQFSGILLLKQTLTLTKINQKYGCCLVSTLLVVLNLKTWWFCITCRLTCSEKSPSFLRNEHCPRMHSHHLLFLSCGGQTQISEERLHKSSRHCKAHASFNVQTIL